MDPGRTLTKPHHGWPQGQRTLQNFLISLWFFLARLAVRGAAGSLKYPLIWAGTPELSRRGRTLCWACGSSHGMTKATCGCVGRRSAPTATTQNDLICRILKEPQRPSGICLETGAYRPRPCRSAQNAVIIRKKKGPANLS